jgi:hypothetical protein
MPVCPAASIFICLYLVSPPFSSPLWPPTLCFVAWCLSSVQLLSPAFTAGGGGKGEACEKFICYCAVAVGLKGLFHQFRIAWG